MHEKNSKYYFCKIILTRKFNLISREFFRILSSYLSLLKGQIEVHVKGF